MTPSLLAAPYAVAAAVTAAPTMALADRSMFMVPPVGEWWWRAGSARVPALRRPDEVSREQDRAGADGRREQVGQQVGCASPRHGTWSRFSRSQSTTPSALA